MGTWCEQYSYKPEVAARSRQRPVPGDGIDKAVTEFINRFVAKHGYKPTLLTARLEELNYMHVRDDIEVRAEHVQPWCIRLYEVVRYRKPVRFDGKIS